MATTGIDLYTFIHNSKDGEKYRFDIFDTAGMQRINIMALNYVKNADGVIVMFSLTDRDSFSDLEEWLQSIEDWQRASRPYILVGNKLDECPDSRKVS